MPVAITKVKYLSLSFSPLCYRCQCQNLYIPNAIRLGETSANSAYQHSNPNLLTFCGNMFSPNLLSSGQQIVVGSKVTSQCKHIPYMCAE